MKNAQEIQEILVAGGGMMGKNIAFVMTAEPAYHVTVYDLYPTDVHAGIRTGTEQLIARGVLTADEVESRLGRITFTSDIDSPLLAKADLVIEAVFEDMTIKQETFAKLEQCCRADTYFCTNSSVMSPSQISSKLRHRERFVGTHFWNPAHLIPLVEVVKTDATADGVAETVMSVLSRVGKKPCLCRKDIPGFIANRLQHALWREAISLVEHGIADAETVDMAIKNSFGLRLPQLGVLENADMVGIPLTQSIHSYVLPFLEDSHQPSPLLAQMLAEGKQGFRSGEGFYAWTPEQTQQCSSDLTSYLIHMLYNK